MRDDLNRPIVSVEDALSREYPEATPQPCVECPWRREHPPGWLGPHTAEEWLQTAHGEHPVACHRTIREGGGWGEKTKQCRGLATFRANICKEPMNPSIVTGPADREKVFAQSTEFLNHHEP